MISEETITWAATRLAEHAKTHALPSVHVILHGGEPLLAGPARLRRVCEALRGSLAGISDLDLRVHTNGVQLNERFLDLFVEFDVKVGISLDGDKVANDRHRLFADGRSSHQQVLDAVALLRQERYRHLYAGLLCTIDIANDPIAVYDALAALGPPRVDFLLPHATWDEPPVRPGGEQTAYADWLMAVFDRWNSQGRPLPVRLFDSVVSTLGGGPSLTESMGLGPADLVVIETDGTLEQADSLKIAYDGAPATGFDVFSDSLDAAARHPGVLARQQGLAGLSQECRSCPVVRSCGGGLYAHRYRTGSGFDNPSAYCSDLMSLVRQVSSRIGSSPAVVAPGTAEQWIIDGFDRLADGTDDGSALLRLASAQRRVTQGWLTVIDAEIGGAGGELWERTRQLLARLDERPGGLDVLLAHPYTRGWAASCLRRFDEAGSDGLPPTGYLAALAASAALRTGMAEPVSVPVSPDGVVVLPTLGRIRFGTTGEPFAEAMADGGGGFVVRLGRDELRIAPHAAPDARWEPVRRLSDRGRGPDAPDVALDDIDPWRDGYARPAGPRLPEAEAVRARGAFAEAGRLLRTTVPGRSTALAAVLTTVTPLVAGHGGGWVADPLAGGRRGMGAVGLTLSEDPLALAREMLSGCQLAALDALVEQCDLYDESDPRSFPVPWGGEPLPAGALLAHAYARSATTALAARPQRHADDTARALDALVSSGALTPVGERFAAGVRSASGTAG